MKAHLWINEIIINDGTHIKFESNDIVVIVGANNSGKSTILREIQNIANEPSWISHSRIVRGLTLGKQGTEEDLLQLLNDLSYKVTKPPQDIVYSGFRFSVNADTAKLRWKELNKLQLSDLLQVFVNSISSDGRLGISNAPQSIDFLNENPQHPIHFLHKDDSMANKFNEAFRKAFNTDITVNKGAGRTIPLHVGQRPTLHDGEDRVSESYLKRLQMLPTIQEQGDGMRSFVGLFMELLFGSQSVTLIDEPEVFLHPPQARMLGRMMSTDVPVEKQIIVATHSEDFLKGLLDSNSNRVKVIRINRNEEVNHSKELTKDQIKRTWSDPLLRYSNVLSGLFHTNVVICEGDMDCKFYSSILDSLIEIDQAKTAESKTFKSLPDPLFIHCGGKHRMPMVIDSLINLDVPIFVVCDFDVLNDTEPLKRIYQSLGGEWSTIESDWKLVKTQIDAKKPELETADIKERIEKILAKENQMAFSPSSAEEIRTLLRKASAWATAKSIGRSFVPSGDATNAYNRLVANLKGKRLFIVEVGEVESFDRTIGNHGPKWANEVLLKNIKTAPELEGAREFVRNLFAGHET